PRRSSSGLTHQVNVSSPKCHPERSEGSLPSAARDLTLRSLVVPPRDDTSGECLVAKCHPERSEGSLPSAARDLTLRSLVVPPRDDPSGECLVARRLVVLDLVHLLPQPR